MIFLPLENALLLTLTTPLSISCIFIYTRSASPLSLLLILARSTLLFQLVFVIPHNHTPLYFIQTIFDIYLTGTGLFPCHS